MFNISLNFGKLSFNKLTLVAVLTVILVAVPMLVSSSRVHKLYVDDGASGTQDGSDAHPYKTISEAIKQAHGDTEIHVANGTYKENLDVKDDVKIFGESKDGVIIKAKKENKVVVALHDDTKINKVTIKGGREGVWVEKNSKASIINCVIKDNNYTGIKIEGNGKHKNDMVSISETVVKDNDGPGIFVPENRRISVTESEIVENKGDGIALGKNISAWIADSSIKNNKKSGMVLMIDGASIWTKSNSIRNNNREGIEVSWSGGVGRINIARSKFFKNDRFAVARVQRGYFNAGLWAQYLTFDDKNVFGENIFGNISKIFVIK